jgi:hypothetical protein
MKTPGSTNNVRQLFPESANENARGVLRASLGETAHAAERATATATRVLPVAVMPLVTMAPAAVMPTTAMAPPYQAVDSTMRGYLQALDPDPMLPLS